MKALRQFSILLVLAAATLMASAQHSVTANATNLTCNSTATYNCTMQVYRASGPCPGSGIGTLTYTLLSGTVPAVTSSSTQQTFTYTDSAAIVANAAAGTKFCYYATWTYTTGTGGPSVPSATFLATIPGPTTPPDPAVVTWSVQ